MIKTSNGKKIAILLLIIMALVVPTIVFFGLLNGRSNEPNLSRQFEFVGKKEEICLPSCTTFVFKRYYFATPLSKEETAKFFERYAARRVYEGHESMIYAAEFKYDRLFFDTAANKGFDIEYYDSENASTVRRLMGLKSSQYRSLIGLVQDDYSFVRSLVEGK